MAESDSYVSSDKERRLSRNETPFMVRESAARALAPRNQSELFYVMRRAETGECRVQRGDEPPVGERYIGPGDAKHQMCRHYDPSAKDPFLCWQIFPRNACTQ